MKSKLGFFIKSEMPSVILFNYIHPDGRGDFDHLLDFLQKLQPFAMKSGIRLVPLILCLTSLQETVERSIDALDMGIKPFIFTNESRFPEINELNGKFLDFVNNNTALQHELKRALLMFQISTCATKYQRDTLLSYCTVDIPIINISEHCGLRTAADFSLGGLTDYDTRNRPGAIKNINDRWMGLVDGVECYGIKMGNALTTSKAETLLAFDNQDYVRTLLSRSEAVPVSVPDANAFFSRTRLIPAYLQDSESIFRFIEYCIRHEEDSDNDLIIHINNHEIFDPKLKNYFEASDEDDFKKQYHCAVSRKKGKKWGDDFAFQLPEFEARIVCSEFQKYEYGQIEINVKGDIRTINFEGGSTSKAKKNQDFSWILFRGYGLQQVNSYCRTYLCNFR